MARGLAADPPVILMDEPFGAVDPITRQRLQDELLSIQRELRKTIVCVTHDIDEAIKLGDRILILHEGAQVAQYDTPEAILANPANDFVADFVGRRVLAQAAQPGPDLRDRAAHSRPPPRSASAPRRSRRGPRPTVTARSSSSTTGTAPRLALAAPAQGRDDPRRATEDLINLDRRATLNDALDTMLTNSHGGAVVTGDRDEYLGSSTSRGHRLHAGAAGEAPRGAGQRPYARRRTRRTSRRGVPATTGDRRASRADDGHRCHGAPTAARRRSRLAGLMHAETRDRAARDPGDRGRRLRRLRDLARRPPTSTRSSGSALDWAASGTIWQHVKLTLVSAVFVVVVAVPLGVALTRAAPAAAPVVVGFANVGQAAPSVGLVVLLRDLARASASGSPCSP